MAKVVGFGDLLVRLSPPGYQRFLQAASFEVNYTGAEANVLVSLGLNGVETELVTRLPDNIIAACARSSLKRYDVGLGHVVTGGDRIGTYYLERGASQRPSKIVYDRKHSSFAGSKRADYNWRAIFKDARHFHFTGITPALGEELPEICMDACLAAKEMGLTVSCDLNYRASLWPPQRAQTVMRGLMPYVDVLIGNEEDSEKLLGVAPANTDVVSGQLDLEGYAGAARRLVELYGFDKVAFTLRRSVSASDNNWRGMLYTGQTAYYSKEYAIHLVDRVGGGDSFAAGLIYALLRGFDAQKTIEYAVGASCLKQATEMDFNLSTADEIETLIGGDGSGRIQR